jgi:large subunit ribosomal protein L21
MMYAVIKTGGKQYRVKEGDVVKVEKLAVEPGSDVNLNDVLMLVDGENVKVGAPRIDGASVAANVVSQGRHPKIRVVKFRRRKHYRKHAGHRQDYTELKIVKISV